MALNYTSTSRWLEFHFLNFYCCCLSSNKRSHSCESYFWILPISFFPNKISKILRNVFVHYGSLNLLGNLCGSQNIIVVIFSLKCVSHPKAIFVCLKPAWNREREKVKLLNTSSWTNTFSLFCYVRKNVDRVFTTFNRWINLNQNMSWLILSFSRGRVCWPAMVSNFSKFDESFSSFTFNNKMC